MKNQRVFWLLLVVVVMVLNSARAEVIPSHFLNGGKLSLRPTVTVSITSILWKHKGDLLAEWIENNVDLTYYGDFNGRTTLNINTGHLEIRNMNETKDSGLYTLEINNKVHGQSYNAIPIEEVPKPIVWIRPLTCDDGQQANCTLVCDGETAKAEPVDYSWKKDGQVWDGVVTKEVEILKTKTELVKTFSCSMKNPVSEKESKPKDNPFFKESSSGNPGGVAAAVIIPLLAVALAALGVWQRKRIKDIFSPPESNAVNSASPSKTENPTQPATEGLMANKEEDGKPDATDPV